MSAKPKAEAAAPAAKKSASKQAAKKKPMILNSAMSIFLDGPDKEKAVKLSDYAVAVSKKFKGTDTDVIKKLFATARAGESFDGSNLGDDVPASVVATYNKAWKQIQADYDTHKENREQYEKDQEAAKAKAKTDREAEAAAIVARKAKAAEAFDKNITALAKPIDSIRQKLDSQIAAFVPEELFFVSKKTGLLTIRKDVTVTEEVFSKAFAGFAKLNETTSEINEAAAEREAQLACQAKKAFPATWQDYFGARPGDLARIKKGMKVYETLIAIQRPVFGTMANMRKALEVNVSDDDKVNLEAKTKIVDQVVELQEEKKRPATQAEITELKNKVKIEYGKDQYIKPKAIFFITRVDGSGMIVAGEPDDKQLQAAMTFGFDVKSGMLIKRDKQGDVIAVKLAPPTPKQAKDIEAVIAEREDQSDEAKEEEATEEESAEEEAPKKPAAKAAKKPVKKEEEEEEEEEAEAEDEVEEEAEEEVEEEVEEEEEEEEVEEEAAEEEEE